MKTVHVVAAVIHNGNQIFATERGYGKYKDHWEFPGGKVEADETAEEALIREIKEELNAEIEIEEDIGNVECDYDDFHLSMKVYLSHVKKGHLTLLEHEDARWLSLDELDSVDWLSADRMILPEIRKHIKK